MVNKLKVTRVISAFPACGKTHYCENNNTEDFVILDSDSSEFSWVKDEDGNNTDVRNPDFPDNYLEHIKSKLGSADIIFVSSHSAVLDALDEANIIYSIVTPYADMKEVWIERFKERGNDEKFIEFLSNNFEEFVNSFAERNANIYYLGKYGYIEDYIEEIIYSEVL